MNTFSSYRSSWTIALHLFLSRWRMRPTWDNKKLHKCLKKKRMHISADDFLLTCPLCSPRTTMMVSLSLFGTTVSSMSCFTSDRNTHWSLYDHCTGVFFNIIKYGKRKNMRDWDAPATHHLRFVPLQFDTRKKLAWGRLPPTSMGIKRFFTKASRRDNSKNKADGETDIVSHCSVSWYFSTFEL